MSSKLRNQTCYLIGAIDRASDLGQGWRNEVSKILSKYNVNIYDPLNKPIDMADEIKFRNERKKWKEEGKYGLIADHMKEIRHVDLRMCDRSDFAIVYIDLDIYAVGTWEEYFWMNREKKPLLLVCKQGKEAIPDWCFACSPHEMFFSNFKEMDAYLESVDKGVIDNSNRWVFFSR